MFWGMCVDVTDYTFPSTNTASELWEIMVSAEVLADHRTLSANGSNELKLHLADNWFWISISADLNNHTYIVRISMTKQK